MWRPYGKESHSTRGSRECFGCVFDLRACTRQAVSLTPLYVMVLVSVCARRRAGPPVHVYDRRVRARAVCSPFAFLAHTSSSTSARYYLVIPHMYVVHVVGCGVR